MRLEFRYIAALSYDTKLVDAEKVARRLSDFGYNARACYLSNTRNTAIAVFTFSPFLKTNWPLRWIIEDVTSEIGHAVRFWF